MSLYLKFGGGLWLVCLLTSFIGVCPISLGYLHGFDGSFLFSKIGVGEFNTASSFSL